MDNRVHVSGLRHRAAESRLRVKVEANAFEVADGRPMFAAGYFGCLPIASDVRRHFVV